MLPRPPSLQPLTRAAHYCPLPQLLTTHALPLTTALYYTPQVLLLAERLGGLEMQEQQAAASKPPRSKSFGASVKAMSFVGKLSKGTPATLSSTLSLTPPHP